MTIRTCLLIAIGVVLALARPAAQVLHTCGMQLNQANVIFCDTFDVAKPTQSRSGDLDANVWGVSRTVGQQNGPNPWPTSKVGGCNQTTTVNSPNDVRICNGRLVNVVNDSHQVIVLAMYPRQPFDWTGRTGTASFDVTNDSQGDHAAWPEFWITDLPIPAPFTHFGSWRANPRNGFGIRFASVAKPGDVGYCPYVPPFDTWRWTVDSAVVIRDYAFEDTATTGEFGSIISNPPLTVTKNSCVVSSSPHNPQGDPFGPMNHVEIRVAQNLIEVWASDSGSTTLKKIATITNANLPLSRGLVWLEDAHYNASKGICHQHDPETNVGLPECQIDHAFGWDNLAFDGPFVYRDFSYDALDNATPGPTNADGSATVLLGKSSLAGASSSWNVLGMPVNPQAAAVRLLFNVFANDPVPSMFTVTVNGHSRTQSWPYPDTQPGSWRTNAISLSLTDLVQGTNVVTIGADKSITTANVNIVLVDVPGGVPVLPGSNNAYPVTGIPVLSPSSPSSVRVIP